MGVVEGVDHVDALQSIGQQGISKKKSRRLDKQTYKTDVSNQRKSRHLDRFCFRSNEQNIVQKRRKEKQKKNERGVEGCQSELPISTW
jgi:hypothetical protein